MYARPPFYESKPMGAKAPQPPPSNPNKYGRAGHIGYPPEWMVKPQPPPPPPPPCRQIVIVEVRE